MCKLYSVTYTEFHGLKPFIYNGITICTNSIYEAFDNMNKKSKNDKNNKIRETIISCVINNNKEIQEYCKYLPRWNTFKNSLNLYIKNLCNLESIDNIYEIFCKIKGGRRYHYDFEISINNKVFNVEFKFNASSADDIPQFVSPMHPSKYIINNNFEEYFYDNFLYKIIEKSSMLEMPDRDLYLSSIHSNKVCCISELKKQYDNDLSFKNYCKKISKEAINTFIKENELDIIKLSNYLQKTQENKHYMCYQDGVFTYNLINNGIYKIKEVVNKTNCDYICKTESGLLLRVKLRFKNGCGIQFPAFQISKKNLTKKELIELCNNNNISPIPKLIRDIRNTLNIHNITY